MEQPITFSYILYIYIYGSTFYTQVEEFKGKWK